MKIPDNLRWKSVTPERTLGQGGQAQVIVVTDSQGEFVGEYAFKALRRKGVERGSEAFKRFSREIAAIKQLSHPTIIKVFDHSSPDDEFQFYVMELIEGAQTLRSLIGTNKNPFKGNAIKSITLFERLVQGLRECENQKIVHRDISPANILVLPDDSIRLIDFGICQIESGERITLLDEGVGTQNYMAPETEAGGTGPVDITADLYSAGKILWSAVTNRQAFSREKAAFTTHSIRTVFPEQPNLWHLVHIFEGTIRNNPSERWRSAFQASGWARKIRELIEAGYLPLEEIGPKCPLCGVGALSHFDQAWQVFHDPMPASFAGFRCDYCGVCLVRDLSVLNKRQADLGQMS